MENWNRKEHFNFFHRMDYPQFNTCMNIDISKFYEYTKKENLSFYYATVHAVTKITNSIDNFRYRIRDGKVVEHDLIHPSFTDMNNEKADDLFKMVTVDFRESMHEFVPYAKKQSLDQKNYFSLDKLIGRDDLIYITCIPWISFTHISHTITLNKNDAVPRISWGKYFKENRKILLPFSIQANHALIDGYHVGKFVEMLQEYFDHIK